MIPGGQSNPYSTQMNSNDMHQQLNSQNISSFNGKRRFDAMSDLTNTTVYNSDLKLLPQHQYLQSQSQQQHQIAGQLTQYNAMVSNDSAQITVNPLRKIQKPSSSSMHGGGGEERSAESEKKFADLQKMYDTAHFKYTSESFTNQASQFLKRVAAEPHAAKMASKYPLFKMLRSITKKFLFNELEILFFAYILRENKWQIEDEQIREKAPTMKDFLNTNEVQNVNEYLQLLLYLMLNAYAVKYYLNEIAQMEMYEAHIQSIVRDFSTLFTYWSKKFATTSLKINPKILNKIFVSLSQRLTDQSKKAHEDYNQLVDNIIQISPPYNSNEKQQQQQQQHQQQLQLQQQSDNNHPQSKKDSAASTHQQTAIQSQQQQQKNQSNSTFHNSSNNILLLQNILQNQNSNQDQNKQRQIMGSFPSNSTQQQQPQQQQPLQQQHQHQQQQQQQQHSQQQQHQQHQHQQHQQQQHQQHLQLQQQQQSPQLFANYPSQPLHQQQQFCFNNNTDLDQFPILGGFNSSSRFDISESQQQPKSFSNGGGNSVNIGSIKNNGNSNNQLNNFMRPSNQNQLFQTNFNSLDKAMLGGLGTSLHYPPSAQFSTNSYSELGGGGGGGQSSKSQKVIHVNKQAIDSSQTFDTSIATVMAAASAVAAAAASFNSKSSDEQQQIITGNAVTTAAVAASATTVAAATPALQQNLLLLGQNATATSGENSKKSSFSAFLNTENQS